MDEQVNTEEQKEQNASEALPIVPHNNFWLEFVLPLLQAKRDERQQSGRANSSYVLLGFNIRLNVRHAAVHMSHVKDELRFFYWTNPVLSVGGFGENAPHKRFEAYWTVQERNEFLELFHVRFPLATLPVLKVRENTERNHEEKEQHDEDIPIDQFAGLDV